jgi:hypothetical protein
VSTVQTPDGGDAPAAAVASIVMRVSHHGA